MNNIFNYPTLAEAYKIAALDAWTKMQSIEDEKLASTRPPFDDNCFNPLTKIKVA